MRLAALLGRKDVVTTLCQQYIDTASIYDLAKLSCMLAEIGEYQEAKVLEEAILRQQRARLGDENMHTINAITKLAVTYQKLGEHAKAIELFGNAILNLTKFRGPKSKDTLQAMCDLATGTTMVPRIQGNGIARQGLKVGPSDWHWMTRFHCERVQQQQ